MTNSDWAPNSPTPTNSPSSPNAPSEQAAIIGTGLTPAAVPSDHAAILGSNLKRPDSDWPLKPFCVGKTDPGMVRSTNQDSYYADPAGRFFIVADGMGGHAGGQEASRLATQALQQHFEQLWDSAESTPNLLAQAMEKANQAILADQIKHPERSDMGTTAVAVVFRQGQPWSANVGDSRLYRFRGAKLEQITEDQTWVARAIKMGMMTIEQARVHPMRHVLAQCLGRDELTELDIRPLEIQPSDRLLLCSDGLTEELTDPLIANQLKNIRSGEMAATALINAAKEHGGRDNITVVIVGFEVLTVPG
jgi:PPM family protein phosphatase